MRRGLVHHTIIIPATISLPLLRGAAVFRAQTIFQNDWFSTRISNFSNLQFFRLLGTVGGVDSFLYSERSFTTGKIYYTMHPPARTNRSQTGTPGASRTQALAGCHRAAAVHAARRIPLVAPVPASPAVHGCNDQVYIFIPSHQYIRMSGFLPFFPSNCTLSCRNPNLM